MTDRELLELLLSKVSSIEKDLSDFKADTAQKLETVIEDIQDIQGDIVSVRRDVKDTKRDTSAIKKDLRYAWEDIQRLDKRVTVQEIAK